MADPKVSQSRASSKSGADETFSIDTYCRDIIEGSGGMNDYERYELVIWNEPERVAAARWTIKCLSNPNGDKDSGRVLEAIMERRRKLSEGTDAAADQYFAGEHAPELLEAATLILSKLDSEHEPVTALDADVLRTAIARATEVGR